VISETRAQEILSRFHEKQVLIVGDLILDRYISGNVSRISPEAPVPVVHVTGERALPGGAANVALNVKSLGGRAVVAGLVGRDRAGEDLLRILSEQGIATDGVVVTKRGQTTVKTRVMAERQQIVRVDREDGAATCPEAIDELSGGLASTVEGCAGVIVEDYGKGAVCQQTVDATISTARQQNAPVGYDPKENHDLRIEGIALATPNYREACLAAGMAFDPVTAPVTGGGGDPGSAAAECLRRAAEVLIEKWRPELLMVTLGPHGMYVAPANESAIVIPAHAREVFDVSGAGDTVIATAMLALLSGATHREAAGLANHAAGVVVAKVGTATCAPSEILACVREETRRETRAP